jgi:hypothetical protein
MNLPLWQELKHQLDRRGIDEDEIHRAVAVLGAPDPAGMLEPPTRDEVSFVAIYMNPVAAEIVYHSPLWREIFQGHPAAKAIYWHEWKELEALAQMGIVDPLLVRRPSRIYLQAHALACYEEAVYWEAWSLQEETLTPWPAFLRVNPLRTESETLLVVSQLDSRWKVNVSDVGGDELERARMFYRAKSFTREGLNL